MTRDTLVTYEEKGDIGFAFLLYWELVCGQVSDSQSVPVVIGLAIGQHFELL